MIPSLLAIIRHRLVSVVFCVLLIAFTSRSQASPADDSNEAQLAVKPWLAQIDSGHYEESYNAAGEALHKKVDEEKWMLILKTARTPLGKTMSRTPTKTDYHPNGFEGTDGEFIMFTYDTSFEQTPKEIEHVVVRREDGKWFCVGYDFGPRDYVPRNSDSNTTITSTTTTASGAPVPADKTKPAPSTAPSPP